MEAGAGYIVAQLVGATLAALFLHAVINVSATYGSNYPAHGYSDMAAFWMELILTMGLVSVILGTASGAQNIGIFGAFGVGGYIALAGLWGSPISGASMNPARTFGPDLVGRTSRATGCTSPVRSPARCSRSASPSFCAGAGTSRVGCGTGGPLHRGLQRGPLLSRAAVEPATPGQRHVVAESAPQRLPGPCGCSPGVPAAPAAIMAACAWAPSSEMRSMSAMRM